MSISLCMISKNEENNIRQALVSVQDFVDEIILVDTGSTDKTIEIAKEYGALIYSSPWKNDFSFHRNEAIKKATCTWILILDCDEILTDTNKIAVKNSLDSNTFSHVKGFNIKITNVIDNVEVASFQSLRLFKNCSEFKYTSPIHEQILPCIASIYGEASVIDLPLIIHHFGYEPQIIQSKNKIKRNLDILLNISEKDDYLYAMIGDEYLKGNMLDKAVIAYKRCFDLITKDNLKYHAMTILNYVTCLINLKQLDAALSFILYIKIYLPNFRDLYFLEYWIYNAKSDKRIALERLDEYISIMNTSASIIEIKKFENLYDLNKLRNALL